VKLFTQGVVDAGVCKMKVCIAWYRPILLIYVGCINWYFRKTLFLRLKIHTFILHTPASTTPCVNSFDKDEILTNHRSFMTSLNIPSGKESEDLPYLYWIPKHLHTNTILLKALSAGTITYLLWREERNLTASWSLNTDLGRLLTHFLSLWIRPCTRDLNSLW
jgi:hypothetical protein